MTPMDALSAGFLNDVSIRVIFVCPGFLCPGFLCPGFLSFSITCTPSKARGDGLLRGW